MNSPRILPITEVLTQTRLRLPPLPAVGASVRLFVVARSGWFDGRRWHRGDLVACHHATDPQGSVVLEARGHGRPRLGSQHGHALFGDGGESCSPLRWRVSGEVVAVLRPDGAEPGGSGEGAPVPGVPGWRVVSLTVGAVERLLDGPTAEPLVRPAEGEVPVALRVVRGSGRRPSGGRARRSPSAGTRGQLSLFSEVATRAA